MSLAIIQARMTSARLPGKVLKTMMGRSVLDWQISRLKRARSISKIVIATSINGPDDMIEAECNRLGVSCYRGGEEDVLDRFFRAAQKERYSDVFRFTADCPLIDPMIVDSVHFEYKAGKYDYVNTGETFCEGVDTEIMSFMALKKAWATAEIKAQREHVTLYINQNRPLFRCLTLESDTDDRGYRFTIDEQNDFEVVCSIIEYLYPKKKHFDTGDIKEFLDKHPEVAKKNAHIIRNEGLIRSLNKG